MQLNYRIQGKGSPIILIHGLFGSLDNLTQLARPLMLQYQVIQIDLRNHGLSPWHDHMSYPAMAEDIVQLMDKLKLEQVTVIGHSMGGKVAMTLASLIPQRVMRMIVLDIAPIQYTQRRHDQIFIALQAVIDAQLNQRSQAASLMKHYLVDNNLIMFLLKSFNQGQWRFNLPVIKQHYPAILGWQAILPWNRPILFIRGSLSDYIIRDYWNSIAQQFPMAKAHVIYGADHWVHGEKPEQTNRVIERFLQETDHQA